MNGDELFKYSLENPYELPPRVRKLRVNTKPELSALFRPHFVFFSHGCITGDKVAFNQDTHEDHVLEKTVAAHD